MRLAGEFLADPRSQGGAHMALTEKWLRKQSSRELLRRRTADIAQRRKGDFMKTRSNVLPFVLILLPLCVFASTKVTDQDEIVTEAIPKPAHIYVYDFSATAEDVPEESALAGQHSEHAPPQTDEQIATGRKLGADIAAELAEEIRAMGLPADRPIEGTEPQVDDIVIRGHLVSEDQGNQKENFVVGLGAGEVELKAAVEGFQMTAAGLRELGSLDTKSTEGKTPGAGVGALGTLVTHNPLGLIASTGMKTYQHKTGGDTLEGRARDTANKIARVLKKRFQALGWID